MIKELFLGNFKAFAEMQKIPIKPLTLIFGPNSSGKSSIIHGLILAHEAQRTGNLDVFNTQLGGDSVDLGGFRQYVHKRDATKRVEWGFEIDASKFEGRLAELLASVGSINASLTVGIKTTDYGLPEPGAVPTVMSYDIEADKELLLRSSRRGDVFRVDRVNTKHQAFRQIIKAVVESGTTTESVRDGDIKLVQKVIDDVVLQMTLQAGRFLPSRVSREKDSEGLGSTMLFPIGKASRKEDLTRAFRFYFPRIVDELIQGLAGVVEEELDRLQYLGPLRSYPPRHLAFLQEEDRNWFAGGAHAWDIVRKDEAVRKAVNEWLGSKERLETPYQLEVHKLVDTEDLKWAADQTSAVEDKQKEAEFWNEVRLILEDPNLSAEERIERLRSLGKTDDLDIESVMIWKDDVGWMIDELTKITDSADDLYLVDQRTKTKVSHRDVGIGVSQVLPVLVTAHASKEKLIAIEQPEIHLHPALQAELGDVFIASALGKKRNTFLLETHSEHLILRVLRRIRESTEGKNKSTPLIRPEQVSLLFVGGTKKGATVQELRIDDRGRLLDRCPGGFFEEDFEELF